MHPTSRRLYASAQIAGRRRPTALEIANCRYEVVFTAFDTMALRAADAAGLGYCPTTRPTASAIAPLVIEETAGVLPELPDMMNGILARDDLDTKSLGPVIAAFEAVVTDAPARPHGERGLPCS